MIFKVPSSPVCVAVACCGVALIFQIVAVSGTGWLVYEDREVGLFRYCVSGDFVEITGDFYPDWWKTVQAFSILALLTIVGSLALGMLHFFKEDTNGLFLASIALCCVSVIFLIIEIAVFGGETVAGARSVYPQYGYGFILSIIACIFSAITAVLFRMEKSESIYE